MARIRPLLLIVVLTVSIGNHFAWGMILYVDSNAPMGGDGHSWQTAYQFLQDGLAVAQAGDEIRVAQGVYKPDCDTATPEGSGDREVSFELPEGVTLKGGYAGLMGADPNARDVEQYETVLSGDLVGDDVGVDPAHFFEDDARLNNSLTILVTSAGSTLDGVIVTGGHALPFQCTGWGSCPDVSPLRRWAGGGVWADGDDVTVRDCRFYHNFSFQEGGGIIIPNHESVSIEGCVFEGNGSMTRGGGLSGGVNTLEVRDCRFIENWAYSLGGGLYAGSSDTVLSDCVFSENRADDDGGGFYIHRGTALIEDLLVTRNTSGRRGGGAVFGSSDINLFKCEFTANKSKHAGAISSSGGNNLIESCLFQGNSAEIYGGALSVNQMKLLSVSSCTLVNNRAAYGTFLSVANTRTSVIISDCIIQNDDHEINTFDQDNIVFAICYSAIADSSVTSINLAMNISNIHVDPCFVEPGYWDANNTPNDSNDDFYVVGDYHLKSQAGHWDPNSESWILDEVTSPCIDTGDPNSPIMAEPFPNGGRINMGAYGGTEEASKSYFGCAPCETIIAGDINGDCKINYLDLAILASHWLE